MPNRKTFSDIKATILKPAMTSQFMVYVDFPTKVISYMKEPPRSLADPQGGVLRGGLNLACSEASLPGSSLATLELTSDRTGVTERHVHRRMFDERIDLTFYVDADNYLPIRAFEFWKEYITGGNTSTKLDDATHFYRMNYPDNYMTGAGGETGGGGGELRVVKFERDSDGSFRGNTGIINGSQNGLTYNFVRAFPIAVASMPISYEASSLLKCTVSMTYIRYFISNGLGDSDSNPAPTSSSQTPALNKEKNTNEYYNNFGDNSQNATNFSDFVDGSSLSIYGESIA